ncbi:MAG: hypothetical protein AB1481_02875 [Candidatus Omnitrophota bacterium]
MDTLKTKSIKSIEEKMASFDRESLRYRVLESAKNFKTSWIEFGRALYSAWKDKLYKDWGFGSFELYTAKEIGIRKETAMKLLRSYYFLEKEEPQYLKDDFIQNAETPALPGYDSVDVLRRAKNNKMLDEEDYLKLKKGIFEEGRDAVSIKRDLTQIIRQRRELDTEEVLRQRKLATVKRFVGILKSLKKEIEISKLLPYPLIKEAQALIVKLESELP